MSVICATVPCYKVERARLGRPELRERPLIVADRLERGHAIEIDERAFELGARRGMTLLQASACAREAEIVVDNPAENARLWTAALDTLDAASPLVEDAGEGLAFLEMRGIDGSAERWLWSVREALVADPETQQLPFRLGLAANKFVARAAAGGGRTSCASVRGVTLGASGAVATGTIVPAGSEKSFAAPLPLHALELDEDLIKRLRLLGIHTLGELAALPHGPFVRRFGAEAADWHAKACGLDRAPLVPRPRALRIERSAYGDGTAEREEQVLFALRSLVSRIADDIAYAGKRCGFLRLTLECEDGETFDLPTTLAQPTAASATMFDLLRARLEGLVVHAPIVGMRLQAERLEEGGMELALFAGRDPDPEIVAIALARLEAALGPHSALRAQVATGNRYETRFAYEPFTAERPTDEVSATSCSAAPRSETGTFIYRVLEPREIDVRVDRGRPARVAGCAVVDIAGPWRVDELWWAEALDPSTSLRAGSGGLPYAADAYDVLLDDGLLQRIVFERDRWYLRGIYD